MRAAKNDVPQVPHFQVLEFCATMRILYNDGETDRESIKLEEAPNVKVHIFTEAAELDEWRRDHTYAQVHNPFIVQRVEPFDPDNYAPFDDPGPQPAVEGQPTLCQACGQPIGTVPGCPECGAVHPRDDGWSGTHRQSPGN